MKKYMGVVFCFIAAGLLAGTAGCDKAEKKHMGEAYPVVRGVSLERVEMKAVPERFEATGVVRPRNAATLSARISGTVTDIYAKEGDRVQRGKLLLTLESRENTSSATGALFAVEEAQRAADEAFARKKLADITFDRFAKLYEEQAATRHEYDTRKTERDMADQGLARARARLYQARESARAAAAISGYTRISAPFKGIVGSKTIERGTTVFPGMPLMTIEEDEKYRLEITVPETMLGTIHTDQSVPVFFDGVDGKYSGRIVEVSPKIDPVSHSFTTKIEISAPGVRSGLFGRAMLPVGEKKGVTVPRQAIRERGQLTFVWVVDGENIVRMRLVKPGNSYGNRVEILAGLTDGERIITGAMEKAMEGARVE